MPWFCTHYGPRGPRSFCGTRTMAKPTKKPKTGVHISACPRNPPLSHVRKGFAAPTQRDAISRTTWQSHFGNYLGNVLASWAAG